MNKLLNNTKIPLPAALWVASNTYDFKPNPNSLSATDFNKSIRQIILRNRLNANNELPTPEVDISTLIKSKIGTAIHDSIEQVWVDESSRRNTLQKLGYPLSLVNKIIVNPNPKLLTEGDIPVYMEQRNSIEIDGYTISGKFDFVVNGTLCDFKTTGTWKYGKLAEADKDYQTQGSIYRLIHKDIISDDNMHIILIFTDFMQGRVGPESYPPSQIYDHLVPLLDELETLELIKGTIEQLETYKDTPEPELPDCTAEQLWQSPPTYKYYKNPQKLNRATKASSNYFELEQKLKDDGNVGVIHTVHSEAKACHTCNVASICSQRLRLIETGLLKV